MKITAIYTDGGCVGRNPSEVGYTWAYVCVGEDKISDLYQEGGVGINSTLIRSDSGFVPTSRGTNNMAELEAVVQALESMEDGWSGVIYSDSELTLGRLFRGWSVKLVPTELRERMKTALTRMGTLVGEHLSGHPTKKELAQGHCSKGNPVSKWNVLADSMCTEESIKAKKNSNDRRTNILQHKE